MLWLFFTIFGLVLFVPTTLLVILFNRFKNTIVLLVKENGSLKKIIITNKELEKGEVTKYKGKNILPIKVSKEEIYYGTWRRWIVKPELESNDKRKITDTEIEEYLNNEDIIKLYLAGKFKDTLLILLYIIIGAVIVSAIVNGYLITTNVGQCTITQDNSTRDFIIQSVRESIVAKV
jgi:hypothetical protein